MELSAPAKTNVSLRVLGKRADGFHELETLMVPLALADTVHLEKTDGEGVTFTCTDSSLPTDDHNLAVRAAKLILSTSKAKGGWKIHLEKRIPHGAGLGGGSSDAATVLMGMNDLLGRPFSQPELLEMAAQLGSDVPFFIVRGPALCKGRGEIVEPADFPAGTPILLMKPPFGVPTPWAYQRWRESQEVPSFSYGPQTFGGHELVNDLERPVFEKYLLLGVMKNWLRAQPEVAAAMMSGSGATVLALLKSDGTSLPSRATAEFGETLWTCLTQTTGPA
ncbi:MAG: 4-(cytidine 5'-diphospho)-2-C-methyl-D-erythritol kinase [Chthoniobacteraceae bacterium]